MTWVIASATLIEMILFAILASGFLSVANLLNVVLAVATEGILAVGMTAVILTGGIDLSVGSVVALTGVVAALTAVHVPPAMAGLVALVTAVGVGGVFGTFSGACVARFRIPPFLVTLALLTICRGLAFVVGGGRSLGNLPDSFDWLGQGHILGIPIPVIVMAIVFVAGWFVLRRMVYGRYVYAVGGNETAAWLAGIDTRRVLWGVYLINGLLAGLAGAVLASRLGAGVPTSGLQYELDVIAAVVVGGTSLTGGQGSVVGTFWGTIFIGVLNNGLNLANVDPYLQQIIVGVVILAAVFLDRLTVQASRQSRDPMDTSPAVQMNRGA